MRSVRNVALLAALSVVAACGGSSSGGAASSEHLNSAKVIPAALALADMPSGYVDDQGDADNAADTASSGFCNQPTPSGEFTKYGVAFKAPGGDPVIGETLRVAATPAVAASVIEQTKADLAKCTTFTDATGKAKFRVHAETFTAVGDSVVAAQVLFNSGGSLLTFDDAFIQRGNVVIALRSVSRKGSQLSAIEAIAPKAIAKVDKIAATG